MSKQTSLTFYTYLFKHFFCLYYSMTSTIVHHILEYLKSWQSYRSNNKKEIETSSHWLCRHDTIYNKLKTNSLLNRLIMSDVISGTVLCSFIDFTEKDKTWLFRWWCIYQNPNELIEAQEDHAVLFDWTSIFYEIAIMHKLLQTCIVPLEVFFT